MPSFCDLLAFVWIRSSNTRSLARGAQARVLIHLTVFRRWNDCIKWKTNHQRLKQGLSPTKWEEGRLESQASPAWPRCYPVPLLTLAFSCLWRVGFWAYAHKRVAEVMAISRPGPRRRRALPFKELFWEPNPTTSAYLSSRTACVATPGFKMRYLGWANHHTVAESGLYIAGGRGERRVAGNWQLSHTIRPKAPDRVLRLVTSTAFHRLFCLRSALRWQTRLQMETTHSSFCYSLPPPLCYGPALICKKKEKAATLTVIYMCLGMSFPCITQITVFHWILSFYISWAHGLTPELRVQPLRV
jgi:hypothetical protein